MTALRVVPSPGNVPDFEELESIKQVRLLIHSRLREYIAAKKKLGALALRANLCTSTVSRAAHHVGTRTTLGTIHKLAPHLGIRLNATLDRNWRP